MMQIYLSQLVLRVMVKRKRNQKEVNRLLQVGLMFKSCSGSSRKMKGEGKKKVKKERKSWRMSLAGKRQLEFPWMSQGMVL